MKKKKERYDGETKGVFNFTQEFPGPHMVRVFLSRSEAWQTLQYLSRALKHDDQITLSFFGELARDVEEDQGNPIEIEIDAD